MQPSLRRVFASASLVVAGYAAFVQFAPFTVPPGRYEHLARAHDYLAHSNRYDTVVVGSSLAARLAPEMLGPHVANLAIPSGAPATGLLLVRDSGGRPRLVLIEINLLGRGADRDLVRSLLRFPDRQLRFLRAFQPGYDPANLAWRGAMAVAGKRDNPYIPPPGPPRQLIAIQRLGLLHPPDIGVLRRSIAELSALVVDLHARGVEAGFFEMPIEPGLSALPGEAVVLREAQKAFPPPRYCWLKLEVPGGAHTVDGIHLQPVEAKMVAGELVQQRAGCLKR